MNETPRTLCWFSAGAASAVATKLALATAIGEVVVAYTDPGSEHPDNERFLNDCEEWLGIKVIRLKSEKYVDTWDVWHRSKFIIQNGVGTRCTAELKKKMRFAFERPSDRQVFGYTSEEAHRAERFREQNPGIDLVTPLIDHGLTKQDCLAMIDRAGIRIPAMYELGYQNNNCVGCPKGGMGYWNKIRIDFPEVFERMIKTEEHVGRSIFTENGEMLFLKDLDPERGNHKTEASFECSLLCALAEQTYE